MSLKTVAQLSVATAISSNSDLLAISQTGYLRHVTANTLMVSMAESFISQMSAATAISATSDLMIIDQSGYTRQEDIFTIVNSGFPAGVVTAYAGATAPTGWLVCDGSAVSRTTYAKLFTAISTAWGVGDGSLTFNLPDLREAAPVGIGTTGSLVTSTGSAVTAHDTYTLGQFKDDQAQGHDHIEGTYVSTAVQRTYGIGIGVTGTRVEAGSNAAAYNNDTSTPNNDGTNGLPRTGTTTRGKRVGVNYIIKY